MTQTKKPKPGSKDAKSNSTLWWILGGVVGLGLIVALAISIAGEEPVDENSGAGKRAVERKRPRLVVTWTSLETEAGAR